MIVSGSPIASRHILIRGGGHVVTHDAECWPEWRRARIMAGTYRDDRSPINGAGGNARLKLSVPGINAGVGKGRQKARGDPAESAHRVEMNGMPCTACRGSPGRGIGTFYFSTRRVERPLYLPE